MSGEIQRDEGFSMKEFPMGTALIAAVLFLVGSLTRGDHNGLVESDIHWIAVEVGFALIIAIGVSVGIERREKHRQYTLFRQRLDIIQKSYFESTFKHSFDNSYLKLAEEMFSGPWFRRNYELVCTISKINDEKLTGSSIIQVDVLSKFEMENQSDKDLDFEWRFFIEKPDSKVIHDNSKVNSLIIGGKELTEREIRVADNNYEDNQSYKRYKKSIPIPAKSSVTIEVSAIMHMHARDTLYWRSNCPADGFRFTLVYPKELNVFGDAIALGKDDITSNIVGNGPKTFVLDINTPLLPYHGALVWWSPKAQDDAG